jgi:hypothetical protein
MALTLWRNAHFEKMDSRDARGKPWASFLRHLPRETLISGNGRAATGAPAPQQVHTLRAEKAKDADSEGGAGVFISK